MKYLLILIWTFSIAQVPINNPKFSDVCSAVYGNSNTSGKSLMGAHANATGNFDAAYNTQGASKTLLDFRNYQNVASYSYEFGYTVSKNSANSCTGVATGQTLYSGSSNLVIGSALYTDPSLTNRYVPLDFFYPRTFWIKSGTKTYSIYPLQTTTNISSIVDCGSTPTRYSLAISRSSSFLIGFEGIMSSDCAGKTTDPFSYGTLYVNVNYSGSKEIQLGMRIYTDSGMNTAFSSDNKTYFIQGNGSDDYVVTVDVTGEIIDIYNCTNPYVGLP